MNKMTISQALRRLKIVKGNLSDYKERAKKSVSYKQSTPPAYNYNECVASISQAELELSQLESAIAITNALTKVSVPGGSDQVSLTQLIRNLQVLKGKIAWLKELPVKAQSEEVIEDKDYDISLEKYVTKNIIWNCALPEAKRDEEIKQAQELFNEINDLVERANHSTLLVE